VTEVNEGKKERAKVRDMRETWLAKKKGAEKSN